MDSCCTICCPQPKNSVIRPIGLAGKLRTIIKWITLIEVFVCILNMMIFSIQKGFMQSIDVWIDFMAYSLMAFCQALILSIVGMIDAGMLILSYTKSDATKAVINSHWLS